MASSSVARMCLRNGRSSMIFRIPAHHNLAPSLAAVLSRPETLDALIGRIDLWDAQNDAKQMLSYTGGTPCYTQISTSSFLSVKTIKIAGGFHTFPSWSYLSQDSCSYGHARRMCTEAIEERVARKKKMTRKQLTKKLKQMRWVRKIKKGNTDAEQKIMERIERVKQSIDMLQQKLSKFELPSLPLPEHDPEPLTPEEFHYLKKIAQKCKNYVPVGRRGIFGGVVQNMHLHWKKHQTVNVWCQHFSKEEVLQMADELARLSGGIVVDIKDGDTIAMYRGRNYTRPKDIIPKNTLTKRKALLKSKYLQAMRSHRLNVERAEQELKVCRECMSQEAADLPPSKDKDADLEAAPSEELRNYYSESESVSDLDVDPALAFNSDSEFDSASESSASAGSTSITDSDSDSEQLDN